MDNIVKSDYLKEVEEKKDKHENKSVKHNFRSAQKNLVNEWYSNFRLYIKCAVRTL